MISTEYQIYTRIPQSLITLCTFLMDVRPVPSIQQIIFFKFPDNDEFTILKQTTGFNPQMLLHYIHNPAQTEHSAGIVVKKCLLKSCYTSAYGVTLIQPATAIPGSLYVQSLQSHQFVSMATLPAKATKSYHRNPGLCL